MVQECAGQFGNGSIVVSGERQFAIVDRGEIQKVVMNLLLNGIESSEPGLPVHVEVGDGDNGVCIRVTDQGCGMSAPFIQKELFVPFHSTKPSGLGIGLFQCRQIIQGHNGRIDVESTPGAGSVFTVWLPRRQEMK
jgi:signal transduction histidine kinase